MKHGYLVVQKSLEAFVDRLYSSSTSVILEPAVQSFLKMVSGPTKKNIVAETNKAKNTKTPIK